MTGPIIKRPFPFNFCPSINLLVYLLQPTYSEKWIDAYVGLYSSDRSNIH